MRGPGDDGAGADPAARDGFDLGLAIGGGAARGFYHVGVLRALAEAGLEPDCIAGTSVGSIVAAIHAAGVPLDELIRLASSMQWGQDVFDVRKTLLNMVLAARDYVSGKKVNKVAPGFLESSRIPELVNKLIGHRTFSQIKPLILTSTDIVTGEKIQFCAPDLARRLARARERSERLSSGSASPRDPGDLAGASGAGPGLPAPRGARSGLRPQTLRSALTGGWGPPAAGLPGWDRHYGEHDVVVPFEDVGLAARVSSCFPGIMASVPVDCPDLAGTVRQRLLNDGGICEQVPTKPLRAVGCRRVLAILIGYVPLSRAVDHFIAVQLNAVQFLARPMIRESLDLADYVLYDPRIEDASMVKLDPELIRMGYEFTRERIPEIRRRLGLPETLAAPANAAGAVAEPGSPATGP
jgi:predicted acylesterase/phospholipase RssA